MDGTYRINAIIEADNGSVIAVNEYPFTVFPQESVTPPDTGIAVYDPPGWITGFIRNKGIAFEVFSRETAQTTPVFVSRTQAMNPAEHKVFQQLQEFTRNGGTVVYLQGGGPRGGWGEGVPASPLLPVKAEIKPAIGLWNGISHVVKDHPIFRGLPVNCAMSGVYENVWAEKTLRHIGGESIVTSIGFDWFPQYDRMKRHYYGSGDTWWGSDVAVVPVGKGRCVTSCLRLSEFFGKDPVADKIFYNLIAWTGKNKDK